MLILPLVAAYLTLAWHFYRSRWQGGVGLLPTRMEPWLLGPVALLHGLWVVQAILTPAGMDLGIGKAVSMLAALTVLSAFIGGIVNGMAGIYPVVLPLAALSLIIQWALPEQHVVVYNLPWFRAHMLVALASYSMLSIATLLALFMTVVESNLHHLKSGRVLRHLPPLLSLERMLFRVMLAGFLLLTAALISGSMFSHILTGHWFEINHKNVFSVISWLVFGGLLAGHFAFGWRGRVALRLTLVGAVTLLLAYLGSKFVLEVLLHRP